MTIFTLLKSGLMRGAAVAAIFAAGIAAEAQTFIEGGVIYSITNGEAAIQATKDSSGNPIVCENGSAPDVYTGDIVIPASVTYNGTAYPVTPSIINQFRGSDITSISLPDNVKFVLGNSRTGAFQNCTKLSAVKLNNDLPRIERTTFDGCTSLKALTIPGSVNTINMNAFNGCAALETLVFEDGERELYIHRNVFGDDRPVVKHLTINRAFDIVRYESLPDLVPYPFYYAPSLETLVIGGSCTSIPAYFFYGCDSLASITFNSDVTYIGESAFAHTLRLTEVALPNSLTEISNSLFSGDWSLKKVTLGNAVTSIGNSAFEGTSLPDGITLPNTLTTIGDGAFAHSKLTALSIPASVTSIGTSVFYNAYNLAKLEVATGSETYTSGADASYIATKTGETLIAYAPASPATSFKGNFKAVAPYAFFCAQKLTSIDLPNCTEWGDWTLGSSGIKSLTIGGTIGKHVAAECYSLETLTINSSEIPEGIASGCNALTTVNLPENITVVRRNAFRGCRNLQSLNFGNKLALLESGCFDYSGINSLTVATHTPPRVGDEVFNPESNITVKVPAKLVDAYKAAPGWSELNIVGDVNLAEGGLDTGMPAGLYYAGDDNQLHCVYYDGGSSTYTINKPHTFKLVSYNSRIYGASAGEQYTFTPDDQNSGDGSLFYVSQVDGSHYHATVLDNTGGNAFKDPFGVYLYGDTLYVSDRNVCMRKISADALNQPQWYPSWFENDWMPFYNQGWAYGCAKADFVITNDYYATDGSTQPRYWIGMKYNGYGLFSFTDTNIGTSESDRGSDRGAYSYLQSLGLVSTAFTIDTKNNHLYIYIVKGTGLKDGLYRIDMNALIQNPSPRAEDFMSLLNAKLIDGSPVSCGNTSYYESIFIRQLAIEGDYLYWCYRAPTAEDIAKNDAQDPTDYSYWTWAEKYDASNPLHQTGIKRVKLGEDNPVVEMVVPGASGYGIVPVNYIGSKTPDGVESPVIEQPVEAISVVDGTIYATADATIVIYNVAGMAVDMAAVSAGDAVATDHLAAGLYIVEARTAAGSQALKFAK